MAVCAWTACAARTIAVADAATRTPRQQYRRIGHGTPPPDGWGSGLARASMRPGEVRPCGTVGTRPAPEGSQPDHRLIETRQEMAGGARPEVAGSDSESIRSSGEWDGTAGAVHRAVADSGRIGREISRRPDDATRAVCGGLEVAGDVVVRERQQRGCRDVQAEDDSDEAPRRAANTLPRFTHSTRL